MDMAPLKREAAKHPGGAKEEHSATPPGIWVQFHGSTTISGRADTEQILVTASISHSCWVVSLSLREFLLWQFRSIVNTSTEEGVCQLAV